MKRSRTTALLLMGSAPLLFTACQQDTPVQGAARPVHLRAGLHGRHRRPVRLAAPPSMTATRCWADGWSATRPAACGIGIGIGIGSREDDGRITGDSACFMPHAVVEDAGRGTLYA